MNRQLLLYLIILLCVPRAAAESFTSKLATLFNENIEVDLSVSKGNYRAAFASPLKQLEEQDLSILVVENPLRLVVDFHNESRHFKPSKIAAVDDPLVKAIRIGVHPGKTRVVLDLLGEQPPHIITKRSATGEFDVMFFPRSNLASVAAVEPAPFLKLASLPVSPPELSASLVPPLLQRISEPLHAADKVQAYTLRQQELSIIEISKKTGLSKIQSGGYSAHAEEPIADALGALEIREEAEPKALWGGEIKASTEGGRTATAAEPFGKSQQVTPPHGMSQGYFPIYDSKSPGLQPLLEAHRLGHAFRDSAGSPFLDWQLIGACLGCAFLAALLIRRDLVTRILTTRAVRVVSAQQDPTSCYAVLGCDAGESDKEIKMRYKHLAKTFHTDKLSSRDLPDELVAVATAEFRKIQQAYETIRDLRGLK